MHEIPYVEPGTLLFRYLNPQTQYFWSALGEILSEQKIYLSSRTGFNDVFDSRPEVIDDLKDTDIRRDARALVRNPWASNLEPAEIRKLIDIGKRRRNLLSKKQIKNLKLALTRTANEFLDQCGLSSFSLSSKQPLLWGHYAAGCTGICIVLKRNESLASGLSLCAKVSYVEVRPRLPLSLLYRMREAQRAGQPIDDITNEIFFLSFLHKDKAWEYEQEARIYFPFEASKKIRFEPDELVGIILGPTSSTDLEERIRAEVRQRAPSVQVVRAAIPAKGFEFVIPDFSVDRAIVA